MQFLKVTFYLQLLQNIGYIPHIVQYILQPILHPIVCTSHSPTPILPLPLSLITISLFSISVSLLLFCYIHQFVVFFRFHIQVVSYSIYLSLSDLISLSLMPSRSIHVAANGKISFIPMAEYYSTVHIHHIFFIHLCVDRHLGCCHIFAIINNAAMNNGVHVSF